VSLSEYEKRVLADMEHSLTSIGPQPLRREGPNPVHLHATRSIVWAFIWWMVGVGTVFTGCIGESLIGYIGVAVMCFSGLWFVKALRTDGTRPNDER
jgi:hypothetical protein